MRHKQEFSTCAAGLEGAEHLLKGDVLEVILLNDGCPQVLVVRHELGQGDVQGRRHIQPKPLRQLGPQLQDTSPWLLICA
jgi:hypothetical protein